MTSRAKRRNPHTGSSFDTFLEEEGVLEETEAVAIKRVVAWQLSEVMRKRGITKKDMATRLKTSRSQLDRLLDPKNACVHLQTITRAARALGKRVSITIKDAA